MTAFSYYMHDGPRTFRFELSGNLAGNDAAKLEQAWRTARSTMDGKVLAIDATFLTGADQNGRALLERWSREGAQFVAKSEISRALVESITGRPYDAEHPSVGHTFEAHFTAASLRAAIFTMVAAGMLLFPMKASAAELKPETLAAWDQYVQQQNARMRERNNTTFLWTDEQPARQARVHAGEVLVAPMIHAPKSVPGGLIHHWIGAAFIAGAHLDDVIAVIRDYDRYPEFYKPSIVESKTLSREPSEDRFSVVMVNKAMFMKRALDSQYYSQFVEVDNAKWFAVSRTTSIRELPAVDAAPIPESESSGYIWRMCTMSRYEVRDGGVYIETEAMALSRPIPMALHWVVDPVVRRFSRATLTESLEQTREATGSVAKSASAGRTLKSWRASAR